MCVRVHAWVYARVYACACFKMERTALHGNLLAKSSYFTLINYGLLTRQNGTKQPQRR